jgi:hypothetical protein
MSRRKFSEQDYNLGNQLSARIILENPAQYGAGMVRWARLWQERNGGRVMVRRDIKQPEPAKTQFDLFVLEPKGARS